MQSLMLCFMPHNFSFCWSRSDTVTPFCGHCRAQRSARQALTTKYILVVGRPLHHTPLYFSEGSRSIFPEGINTLMMEVLSPWPLTLSHLIQGEAPKTPFSLLHLSPAASCFLGRCLLPTKNPVEGLEHNPVGKGFIFIFKSALDFQEPKVQIAAGLIQPFHKQFGTMQFVQTGQVSRPLAPQHIISPSFHVSASLAIFHFPCLSSLTSGEHAKLHTLYNYILINNHVKQLPGI